MRAVAVLVVAALVSGCLGFGERERGGWSVFAGGISCRDCERLVDATPKGSFEVDRVWRVGTAERLFAWYESPIAAGERFVLTWDGPPVRKIETRTAATGGGWDTHTHACMVEGSTAKDTPSAAPTPPPSPAVPPQRCVWDHTPRETLAAPDNGITIIWEVENPGSIDVSLAFSAKRIT